MLTDNLDLHAALGEIMRLQQQAHILSRIPPRSDAFERGRQVGQAQAYMQSAELFGAALLEHEQGTPDCTSTGNNPAASIIAIHEHSVKVPPRL